MATKARVADKILLPGSTDDELAKWLKPSQRQNLSRTLKDLEHEKDIIALAHGRCRITRRGIHEIERRNLIEIE
jgi:hypothetical protein